MTNENYKDLVASSPKLIIDTWAEWCGPCKRTTPVFEEMAEKYANKNIVFATLDADNNTTAAGEFKVMSLPTFIIFKNGQLTKKWAGADVGRLRKEITSLVDD
jgi:thioredoxin 1